jgi:hypothetical protein
MEDLYIDFTGEENEKEFLEKCYKQWEKINEVDSETQRLIIVGSVFSEIRHRLDEME